MPKPKPSEASHKKKKAGKRSDRAGRGCDGGGDDSEPAPPVSEQTEEVKELSLPVAPWSTRAAIRDIKVPIDNLLVTTLRGAVLRPVRKQKVEAIGNEFLGKNPLDSEKLFSTNISLITLRAAGKLPSSITADFHIQMDKGRFEELASDCPILAKDGVAEAASVLQRTEPLADQSLCSFLATLHLSTSRRVTLALFDAAEELAVTELLINGMFGPLPEQGPIQDPTLYAIHNDFHRIFNLPGKSSEVKQNPQEAEYGRPLRCLVMATLSAPHTRKALGILLQQPRPVFLPSINALPYRVAILSHQEDLATAAFVAAYCTAESGKVTWERFSLLEANVKGAAKAEDRDLLVRPLSDLNADELKRRKTVLSNVRSAERKREKRQSGGDGLAAECAGENQEEEDEKGLRGPKERSGKKRTALHVDVSASPCLLELNSAMLSTKLPAPSPYTTRIYATIISTKGRAQWIGPSQSGTANSL